MQEHFSEELEENKEKNSDVEVFSSALWEPYSTSNLVSLRKITSLVYSLLK